MNVIYLNDLNNQEVNLYLNSTDFRNPIKYPNVLITTNPPKKILQYDLFLHHIGLNGADQYNFGMIFRKYVEEVLSLKECKSKCFTKQEVYLMNYLRIFAKKYILLSDNDQENVSAFNYQGTTTATKAEEFAAAGYQLNKNYVVSYAIEDIEEYITRYISYPNIYNLKMMQNLFRFYMYSYIHKSYMDELNKEYYVEKYHPSYASMMSSALASLIVLNIDQMVYKRGKYKNDTSLVSVNHFDDFKRIYIYKAADIVLNATSDYEIINSGYNIFPYTIDKIWLTETLNKSIITFFSSISLGLFNNKIKFYKKNVLQPLQ